MKIESNRIEYKRELTDNLEKELMRIFRNLDMVEQLGSGIPHILAHYPQSIYHFTPNFIRLVMPYADGFSGTAEQAESLLTFCREPRSREEMQSFLDLKHREHFRADILKPMLDQGLLELTIPNKPKSPKQKYVIRLPAKAMIKDDEG